MNSKRIFRKVSLDRLSSPEQLDQVMRVTSRSGWAALGGIGVLLLTGVAWALVGTLAENVGGQGILIKAGGVLEVVSTASGRVTDVSVAVGDSISEGQVVAWVAQPELTAQLRNTRQRLEALRRERAAAAAVAEREAELQLLGLQQQRANLVQAVAAGEENLAGLAERTEAQERLLAEGLVTRSSVLTTRQQYEQTRQKLLADRRELTLVEVNQIGIREKVAEGARDFERRITDLEIEVAQVERDLETGSQIVSPYTGRVLETMIQEGKLVNRGEAVLSLDLTSRAAGDLLAVVYVPSAHGKKVRPGMVIKIAPSTVRQEEHGMMLGRVTFVSSFPSTSRGMAQVLKNDQLVAQLSGGGAPYEVHAELLVDPSTPSRYRWSSSQGPPTTVQSGTLATATITTAEQRPIGRVIPALRRWTGI